MRKTLVSQSRINLFRKNIWDYYRNHKRDFLWRQTRDPYKILVSEIMLQQTQTGRVESKYAEFLKRFPGFGSLARAPMRSVLHAWSGLGYNRRALALKRAAEIVAKKYGGKLPKDEESLVELPGIGPGTAGAIRAFAFNLPSIFIETNIRRVFIHFFFTHRRKVDDGEILKVVKKSLPTGRQTREWYWALMDYGAMLGREAKENPNKKSAHYTKQSKFEGSNRQLRGRILRLRLANPKISITEITQKAGQPRERVAEVLRALRKEGFV
jgi:A/G-specific adenine glycosylase